MSFYFYALKDSQKALMKVQIEFCSEKIGIPVEEPQTLINNVIKGEKDEYKCFSKCFLEQLGEKHLIKKKFMTNNFPSSN